MSKNSQLFSEKARKKIEDIRAAEEKKKQAIILKQRMEIARAGVLLYQKGQYKEALENYYRYFSILERWKNVKRGALQPKDFDTKKDVAELLLLAGIFWDLAKLQDRSKTKDKSSVKNNLDKFITFSKGMPYQHMCAELVRKYLMNEKAVNRVMFKDAHVRLGGGKCFIATAVEEYCAPSTLTDLRAYRDLYLLNRRWGRAFVKAYYAIGPWIARAILRTPESLQIKIAKSIDRVAIFTQKL